MIVKTLHFLADLFVKIADRLLLVADRLDPYRGPAYAECDACGHLDKRTEMIADPEFDNPDTAPILCADCFAAVAEFRQQARDASLPSLARTQAE